MKILLCFGFNVGYRILFGIDNRSVQLILNYKNLMFSHVGKGNNLMLTPLTPVTTLVGTNSLH